MRKVMGGENYTEKAPGSASSSSNALTAVPATLNLFKKKHRGLAGSVRAYEGSANTGGLTRCPIAGVAPIHNTQVASAVYELPPFQTHVSALLPGFVPPPIKLASEQDFRPGRRYYKKVYGKRPKRKPSSDSGDLSKANEADERRLLTQRALGGGKKGKVANNLVGGKSGLANYHSDQQKEGSGPQEGRGVAKVAKKGFTFQQQPATQKGQGPPKKQKGFTFS